MTGEQLLEHIEGLDTDLITEANVEAITTAIKRKRIRPRKLMAFMLAAVFLCAFAITTMAAVEQEWEVAILNFMGISGADTTQLADGTVSINASDQQNGVTLTASSSIGSKNSVYIRIDTDYQVPKEYDLDLGYFVPEVRWNVWKKDSNQSELGGGSYSCDVDADRRLYLIVQIMDVEDINKCHVNLEIKDFSYWRDYLVEGEDANMDPQTLVLEGPWNLNWKYSYRARSVKKRLYKTVKLEGAAVNITKIEITPLEVIVKGKATFDSKEARRQFTSMNIDCITLTDGTVIWVEANGGGCGTSKNPLEMVRGVYDVEGYATIEVIGQPLDPKEVQSVTIGGVEIEL